MDFCRSYLFTSVLFCSSVFGVEVVDTSDLSIPDDVFSGMYVGAGAGVESLDNKYDIQIPASINMLNITRQKDSIRTNVDNLFGVFGFGGVFNRFYYVGLETDFTYRISSKKKDNGGVQIENKKNYAFDFKLRGGYIFRPAGVLLYTAVSADRSINHISIKNNDGNFIGRKSFGSYHPSISVGAEKKLRDNWSVRVEFSYTIGIWDDTGRTIDISNVQYIPFKAKTNKKSVKLMVCKYL